MIQNNPKFRAAIYVAAVVLQLASYFTRAADSTGAYADAVQDAANFIAAMAGITAVGNLSVPAAEKPAEPTEPAV